MNDNPRTQSIDIETPATGHVFKGTVQLNIDLSLLLRDGFNVGADLEASAKVIRDDELLEDGET